MSGRLGLATTVRSFGVLDRPRSLASEFVANARRATTWRATSCWGNVLAV